MTAAVERWRKKPIAVETMEWRPWEPESVDAMIEWLTTNGCEFTILESDEPGNRGLLLGTLEDRVMDGGGFEPEPDDPQVDHIASPRDRIIRGVEGEFYPCKPDIFLKTYEQ